MVFHTVNINHGKSQYITRDWQINSPAFGMQSFKLHLKKTTFWGIFFFSKKTSKVALENIESREQIEV